MKKIYFCVDGLSFKRHFDDGFCVHTYDNTEYHIKKGLSPIVTTSMAHFSFDLITFGYEIYLCYEDKEAKIEPHMDLSGIGEPGKDLRFGHNIFKLFRGGVFDELVGIDYNKHESND